ncbi:MAG: crossover junction endodeoxyribonuclease RuvC [Bacteroidota bacterium]|nr:crossover junction endodeoxyribonuclease RuvC [Bacteroidota bacterium]
MNLNTNRILGIDPGTSILGFAIIEIKDNKPIVLDANVVKLQSFKDQQTKLREIFLQVQEIIENYLPAVLSIESPFYGKNPQSMLKLGRAQGVAIAASMVMGVEIFEFSPKQIKLAVTGNGNSSKEQVAAMLTSILSYNLVGKYLDATDALAAALCCHYRHLKPKTTSSNAKDWKQFLTANPKRILK